MAIPKSILITGCNRGIGLGLVKEFLKLGDESLKIIATCRNKSKADELSALESSNPGRLKILELEVDNYQNDYKDFATEVGQELGERGLNLFINNAGTVGIVQTFENLSGDNMMNAVTSNPEGKMGCEKAVVVQMSTSGASIADNAGGKYYPYRCSKSALNMSMKNLSIELRPVGILVMSMHPGWVVTDMGGPNAMITVDECVSTMVKTISQLGENDHGSFLRYNNTSIPW
ncbi:unnamed protein product [Lepeophtheirus salmonis]|uniref:(salmon louse) hypothetical protein n=1 Tax=Lepeophtheirus salmonis TaxID=72036 RepID=A0A7R8CJR7_LEPSM|nr:unnamed protein product [Lepeophtheirus salmonis]CAF2838729.1 unnamed protein product [Lepeophtheirus salmonis]